MKEPENVVALPAEMNGLEDYEDQEEYRLSAKNEINSSPKTALENVVAQIVQPPRE